MRLPFDDKMIVHCFHCACVRRLGKERKTEEKEETPQTLKLCFCGKLLQESLMTLQNTTVTVQ